MRAEKHKRRRRLVNYRSGGEAFRISAQRGPVLLNEELRVQAIELELQNDELRGSRARLESSQGEFQRLFESAPVAYFVVDGHGIVQRANERAHHLLETSELTQRRLSRFVKVQQLPAFDGLLDGVDHGVRAVEVDLVAQGPNACSHTARLRAVRLSTEPARILVCAEDVTDLKAAMRRAVESEASLKHLIEVSPDAIAVLRRGNIIFANAALRELIELKGETLIDTALVGYARADEGPSLDAALRLASERGSGGYVQFHLKGSQRHVEARFAALSYERTPCVIVMARDITERMRMVAEWEHDSRLASLGMLVAGVAHEINNPLAFALPNLTDALERLASVPPDVLFGVGTAGDVTELVREAKIGVERVAAIVKDLKVFHQVKDSLEIVDLNQIVVDTLKMSIPKLGRHIQVTRDLGKLPAVRGNAGRMGQVVLNLLLNAAQAMPEKRPRDGNRVQVRTWYADGSVHLEVQDNGRGIEEQDLKQLFDPFFSRRSGGTGLGLTVCASLVREMDGWIEVESQVDHFTRFVLRFPKADPALTSTVPTAVAIRQIAGLRLLVVDDEPLIFRTLRRSLGQQLTLVQARSGYEAIEHLRNGLDVDAVLTDLVMPNGSGIELFAWVRQHRPELSERIFFMTGMAHPETLGDVPERPQLQKPFSMAQVQGLLASLPPQPEVVRAAPPA